MDDFNLVRIASWLFVWKWQKAILTFGIKWNSAWWRNQIIRRQWIMHSISMKRKVIHIKVHTETSQINWISVETQTQRRERTQTNHTIFERQVMPLYLLLTTIFRISNMNVCELEMKCTWPCTFLFVEMVEMD